MADFGKRDVSRHLEKEEQEEQERQRKQVELLNKMVDFGKRGVSMRLEQKELLKSCYLTIIPESHSNPEYSRQVLPLVEQVMSEEGISTPNVLNVSEGTNEDEFFEYFTIIVLLA